MQTVGGHEPLDGELGRFYDAIENPRSIRNELPLLRGARAARLHGGVRERGARGARADRDRGHRRPAAARRLRLRDAAEHERQHQETMLQLLQMVDGYPCPGRDPAIAGLPVSEGPEMVAVAAGGYPSAAAAKGSPTTTSAPRTRSSSMSSRSIARRSATAQFAAFIAETGEPSRRCTGSRTATGGWSTPPSASATGRSGAARDPRRPGEAGRALRRLGRQAAADRVRVGGCRRPAPIASRRTSTSSPTAVRPPAPTRTAPPTAARCRCSATSGSGPPRSSTGYPGFEPFPYREYSEVFFGPGYRVLRGGSWATPAATSSGPQLPQLGLPGRRQIFSGFRCARDGR